VHSVRTELFHFLSDGAVLELDGKICRPQEDEEFLIPPGVVHRFWAEDKPFRMLVVCFGNWTAEDQERIDDDYGRKGKKLEIDIDQ
jgi:mannose-6-phosphate isomerase-like protein (cupin superfamily)